MLGGRVSIPERLCERSGPAIRFVIYGEPKGFLVARGRSQWTKGLKAFRLWCDEARKACNAFGVETPLYCDAAYPLWIGCSPYYSGNVHCDPGNTSKGLIDTLFRGTNGPGDKFVAGGWDSPSYCVQSPRTLVEIRGWILRKYPELVSDSWGSRV